MIARQILNSGIYNKPPLYVKVWLYLLCRANHADYKGLRRGQLWTSIPEIQDACHYYIGYRRVTPTIKEVRSVFDFLRNPYEGEDEGHTKGAMIVTAKGTHGTLVTVCNYSIYQDFRAYEGQGDGRNEEFVKEIRREPEGPNINNALNTLQGKEIAPISPTGGCSEIISFLNTETGSSFRANTAATQRIINARLSDGFSVEDFKAVIDCKAGQWKSDPKMSQYLRPSTLFAASKFDGYLQEARKSAGTASAQKRAVPVSLADLIEDPPGSGNWRPKEVSA